MNGRVTYENGVLRYIVPFYVKKNEAGSRETNYEYICRCLERQMDEGEAGKPVWRRIRENQLVIDLFDHIAEWMNPREDGSEIGCSWEYAALGEGGNSSLKIGWVCGDRSVMQLLIRKIGLTVFATGVGFLWYEISQGKNGPLQGADMNELLEFSNKFKELAQDSDRLLDLSVPFVPVDEAALAQMAAGDGANVKVKNCVGGKSCRLDAQKLIDYASHNVLSIVSEQVAIDREEKALEEETDPDRRRSREAKLTGRRAKKEERETKMTAGQYVLLSADENDQKIGSRAEWRLALKMGGLGLWIRRMLNEVCGDVRFFENKLCSDQNEMVKVPDKALVFGFAAADFSEEKPLQEAVCCLAKGYSERYHFSGTALSSVLKPFDHSGCFISREGCAYISGTNASDFLRGDFRGRFLTTYFQIYMLLLQQFYGILNFSRRAAEDMPSNPGVYFKEDDDIDYVQRMNQLLLEMNSFLVKNQFSSVSNVQHINDFYQYGYRQLDIGQSLDSLFGGLQALTEMQQNHRSAQQEIAERKKEALRQKQYADEMKREKERQQQEDRQRKLDEKREKEANDKIESAMRRLGALAILSALCDGIGFVRSLSDGLQHILPGGVFWTVLECICSIVICILVFYVGKQAVVPIMLEEKQHWLEWRGRRNGKRRAKGRPGTGPERTAKPRNTARKAGKRRPVKY